MSCHDGTTAGDAGWHAGKSSRSTTERDHPVGVKYRDKSASAGSEDVHLVSEKALDPRVRLFNSAVGCGSCHSVYSQTDSLLVVSNQRSQLCLKCHKE
jgi:predicted CXXCH cytochrome family protein